MICPPSEHLNVPGITLWRCFNPPEPVMITMVTWKERKTDRKGEHGIPGTGHIQDASPCSCMSGNRGIWHVCVAIWRPEGCQPCSTFASSGNELNSLEWKIKKNKNPIMGNHFKVREESCQTLLCYGKDKEYFPFLFIVPSPRERCMWARDTIWLNARNRCWLKHYGLQLCTQ